MAALSNKYRSGFAPVLAIQVHNKLLGEEILRRVQSVEIKLSRKKHATLSIKIKDDTYEIFDRDVFALNKHIYIYCGWPDEVTRKGPFRVTGYTPVYPEGEAPSLTVEGKDVTATKMKNRPRSRSWSGSTARDIIQKISKEHKLKAFIDIQETDNIKFDDEITFTQSGESNSNLLHRLANNLGYSWGVDDGILYFNRPEKVSSKPVVLEYRVGKKSLKTFSPKFKMFSPNRKSKGKTHARLIYGDIDMASNNADFLADLSLVRVAEYEGDPYGRELTKRETKNLTTIDGLGSERYNPKTHDASINDRGSLFYTRGDKVDALGIIRRQTQEAALLERRDRWQSIPETAVFSDGLGDTPILTTTPAPNTAKMLSNRQRFLPLAGEASLPHPDATHDGQPVGVDREASSIGTGIAPMTELGLKGMGRSLRNAVVESADMVPTVPSWKWSAHDTVYVKGVHKKASGLYEIHEVVLTYDKDKGMSTKLKGKKRTFGSKVSTPVAGAPVSDLGPIAGVHSEVQSQSENPREKGPSTFEQLTSAIVSFEADNAGKVLGQILIGPKTKDGRAVPRKK